MQWFKNMEDSEIMNYLVNESNACVELMRDREKEISLKRNKKLDEKIVELIEYVSNIKGAYIGSDLYNFYNTLQNELGELKRNTKNRMYEAYKAWS